MNELTVQNAVEAAKSVKAKVSGIPADSGPSTVRRSLTIAQLAAAMAKAQGELKNPPKDSVNPHFKSRYADLATVRDAVVPVFARNGLAVIQLPCEMDDAPALTTLVTHTSGEWLETTIRLRPGKLDPQGVGSALTYARRYALQSVAGVAAEDDDDGNAGSRPAAKAEPAKPAAQPASGVGGLASNIATLFREARCREDGRLPYEQMANAKAGGAFTLQEERMLDEAWRTFDAKFPKPAKA